MRTIYPVRNDTISLGTDPVCDIVIEAEIQDLIYCQICRVENGYELLRCQEILEILINGQPQEKMELCHGDVVVIADTVVLFTDSSDESYFSSSESISESTERLINTLSSDEKGQKQLVTLYKVSNLIFYTFNLQELLEQLAAFLVQTFDANTCILMWKDTHTNSMRPMIIHKDDSHALEQEVSSYVSLSELKYIYQRKRATLWYKTIGGKSRFMLGAPLLFQQEVTGFIILEGKKGVFLEGDLRLLSNIALLAASGIASVLRYQERREHLQSLERLNGITLKLSSILDRKKIFKKTAREICHVLQCSKSAVMLLDEEECLRIIYALGMKEKHSQRVRVPIGKGLAGWVVANGRAILSSELPEHLSPTYRKKYLTDSFIIVPIFDHTSKDPRPIGALCATDRVNKIPFSVQDRELMTFLAEQVGVAFANAELFEKATIDHVTRLYLRGYLFEKLDELLEHTKSTGEPLSLLLLDLDHFKSINDNYGHHTGDVVLKELGKIIKAFVREDDLAGRYGGEEFIVALRNVNYQKAFRIANRLRDTVRKYAFNRQKRTISVTLSIGVAEYLQGDQVEDLILRGDRAMYRAKESGRDRVM